MLFGGCLGEIFAGAGLSTSLGVTAENQPEIIAESGAEPSLGSGDNEGSAVKANEGDCDRLGIALKRPQMGGF